MPKEEYRLPDDPNKKKKMHPVLDWALSVSVLVGGLVAFVVVMTNRELSQTIKNTVLTKQGVIVGVILIFVVGTVQQIIHKKKMNKIKQDIQDKMTKDWGKKSF